MVEHPDPFPGFSNAAHFKTSDQANAVMWLRYMSCTLLKTACITGSRNPRQWLSDGNEIYARQVSTRFGEVGVTYNSEAAQGELPRLPISTCLKGPTKYLPASGIRKLPIESVMVNGRPYKAFDGVGTSI